MIQDKPKWFGKWIHGSKGEKNVISIRKESLNVVNMNLLLPICAWSNNTCLCFMKPV